MSGIGCQDFIDRAFQNRSSNETTFSIFAKKGTLSVITLFANISGDSNLYQRFDLENGIVDAGSGMSSNKIEDYGNGWYRCSSSIIATTSHRFDMYVMQSSYTYFVINYNANL